LFSWVNFVIPLFETYPESNMSLHLLCFTIALLTIISRLAY
jgi:hypothetical protein